MAITNIVGEGFADAIRKQINRRQTLKGKRDRNPEGNPKWLVWQNGNTGWVKMISSVDVDPEKRYFHTGSFTTKPGVTPGPNDYIKLENSNTPIYYSGRGSAATNPDLKLTRGDANNLLARSNMLMGGIYTPYNPEENYNLQAGIARYGSFLNSNAYGFGGLEFGLQPIPGITSFNIKSENRGSLRTATVGIRAYNKVQFDVISTLYMSLGYTMLIEWGNAMYYDNEGVFYENNQFSLQEDFLSAKYKWTELLPEIKKLQLASNGNYDAALCRVVNFNWKLNKDMSYDITVILRSVGDVIEALKINTLSTNKVNSSKSAFINYFPKVNNNTVNTINAVNAALNIPSLQQPTVTNHQNQLSAANDTLSNLTGQPTATVVNAADSTDIGIFIEEIKTALDNVTTPGTSGGATNGYEYTYEDKNGKVLAFKEIPLVNSVTGDPYYYINFGYFLFLLETKIIPNIKTDPNLKALNIDYHIASNIISIDPELVSANPRICTFKQTIRNADDTDDIFISPVARRFTFEKNGNSYGYFMNVYFDMDYLVQLLLDLQDNSGAVILINFLNKLCIDFCISTGNYNKITTTIDYDTNTIRFIDEVSLPDRDAFLEEAGLPTTPANFHMFGYFPVSGSDSIEAGIVRDLSLVTTVSPKLAHMLSIGAQASGYAIGEDATALSALNRGLKDRIRDDWYYPGQTSQNPTDKSLKDQYAIAYENFYKFVETLGTLGSVSIPSTTNSVNFNTDDIDTYINTNRQFIEYKQAKATLEKQKTNPLASSSRTGFLPFNLSLTIDGLSGIKIYNRFTADTEFLPPNYPSTIEFIITGISHEIKDNQWITNIESLAVPVNPLNGNAKKTKKPPTRGENYQPIAPRTYQPTAANPNPTPTLRQAVKDQADYFFGSVGQGSLCARWTYNIAYNLKKYMDTNSTQAIPLPTPRNQRYLSSANADQQQWRDLVNKLDFYDLVEIGGGNMTLPDLKKWINNSTFNYGDILNYYAPGHSGRTHMHAQIYTGDIYNNSVKWTSSTKANYGVKIPYGGPSDLSINPTVNTWTWKVYYFKVKDKYVIKTP